MPFTLQDPVRKPAAGEAEAAAPTLDPVSLQLVTAQNNRLIEQAINGTVCRLSKSAAQTVPNNTATLIALDATSFDTGELSSGTGVTVATAGIYSVSGLVSFAFNATGERAALLYLNGAESTRASGMAAPTGPTQLPVVDTVELDPGDTVQLYGLQASGGDLATVAGQCSLTAHLIAPT